MAGHPHPLAPNSILYRGCNASFPDFKENDPFMFRQFTSTSLDRDVAERFMDRKHGKPTMFIVRNMVPGLLIRDMLQGSLIPRVVSHLTSLTCPPNYIGLSHHSAFMTEFEVLLWPLETFKIAEINNEGTIKEGSIKCTEVYLDACKIENLGCTPV